MVDAGIQPGDYVVVDKIAPYKTGDTVVAMIETASTVKLLMGTESGYFLRAANAQKNYPDIYPTTERNIVGKVISSFRTYN
ncbi:MAG: S24 family peptidase [Bacteroidota bacterium]